MSITKGFRLEVVNNHLVVESTDFDRGAKVRVDIKDGEGSEPVVVDGEKLSQIVRLTPKGSDLQLEKKGKAFHITSSIGSFAFKLALMDESQFPRIPGIPKETEMTEIKLSSLIDIIEKLKFATNKGTERVFEEVIFLRDKRSFATDTFKIGMVDSSELGMSLDIPVTSLGLIKLIDNEEVKIASTSEMIFLQGKTLFIAIRRLVVKTPEIARVLESHENAPVSYTFDVDETKELRENLRRAKIVDNVIHILPKENKIICGSRNAEGEFRFAIDKTSSSHTDLGPLCFNAGYLAEALQNVESMEIGFFGQKRPLSIKAEGFICLIQGLTTEASNMEGE